MKIAGAKWAKSAAAVIAVTLAVSLGAFYEGDLHTAQPDLGGVPTICYGHTKNVRAGQTATEQQCLMWLHEEMQEAFTQVVKCVGDNTVSVGQLAAFTDAVYNLGPGVICSNTGLQRALADRDVTGACTELMRWMKGNKTPQLGLIKRRADEYALCIGGIR